MTSDCLCLWLQLCWGRGTVLEHSHSSLQLYHCPHWHRHPSLLGPGWYFPTPGHHLLISWGRVTSPPPIFVTKNFTICILYFWFASSSSPWRQWTVRSSLSWCLELRSSRHSPGARLPPAAVANTIFVEDNDTRHLQQSPHNLLVTIMTGKHNRRVTPPPPQEVLPIFLLNSTVPQWPRPSYVQSVPVQLHRAIITQPHLLHWGLHPLDEGSGVLGAKPHLGYP